MPPHNFCFTKTTKESFTPGNSWSGMSIGEFEMISNSLNQPPLVHCNHNHLRHLTVFFHEKAVAYVIEYLSNRCNISLVSSSNQHTTSRGRSLRKQVLTDRLESYMLTKRSLMRSIVNTNQLLSYPLYNF